MRLGRPRGLNQGLVHSMAMAIETAHSGLGYRSPINYERRHLRQSA